MSHLAYLCIIHGTLQQVKSKSSSSPAMSFVPFSVPLDIVIAQRAAGSLLTLRPHTQAYLPSVCGCAAALDIIIV